MASLKEVKLRIQSVKSTRKITSAMKMVASSKLHHAQQRIENLRPYAQTIAKISSCLNSTLNEDYKMPFHQSREVRRVAIVVFTSNSSLCGGFNSNVVKELKYQLTCFANQNIQVVKVYAFGKKGFEACHKLNLSAVEDHCTLIEHPSYDSSRQISTEIMNLYNAKEIDACHLLYHRFKSSATQILTTEQYLPIKHEVNTASERDQSDFYIIEPSTSEIIHQLFPKVLSLQLHAALLESIASEHAARIIAMQVATDNADDLLSQLQLQYNKGRQAAITAELLDIVGGSMA